MFSCRLYFSQDFLPHRVLGLLYEKLFLKTSTCETSMLTVTFRLSFSSVLAILSAMHALMFSATSRALSREVCGSKMTNSSPP